MIKNILLSLLILVLTLSSCTSESATEIPAADNHAVGETEVLGCDFVIFDSDGDGTKDDIAELTCLGMSGGYGSFRVEAFISEENSYRKVFDSEQHEIDISTYKNFPKISMES